MTAGFGNRAEKSDPLALDQPLTSHLVQWTKAEIAKPLGYTSWIKEYHLKFQVFYQKCFFDEIKGTENIRQVGEEMCSRLGLRKSARFCEP